MRASVRISLAIATACLLKFERIFKASEMSLKATVAHANFDSTGDETGIVTILSEISPPC